MTEERYEPTAEDGLVALRDHVRVKALEARARHPNLAGEAAVRAFLADEECVRYPTSLDFNAEKLEPGEFAWAEPLGASPGAGFQLHIHPRFQGDSELLPRLVAYHVVKINYGDIATFEEAEIYGATLLGLDVEEYYQSLCEAADALEAPAPCEGRSCE